MFAQSRRTVQEHVIERLASPARGLDRDLEILNNALLPDVMLEAGWPQGDGDYLVFDRLRRRDERMANGGRLLVTCSGDGLARTHVARCLR